MTMPTLLFLHAHPDDESILTGATIAKATELGYRVIVAFASRGDAGVTKLDLGGETLGERREAESRAACASLGAERVLFLGYDDSGMADSDTTSNPTAFSNADLEEVTARLAIALVNETIEAVVGYDANGTYGHPDHVQIHRVAHACAEALHASWVLDATYNRDHLRTLGASDYGEMDESFASSEADLTHFVSGKPYFQAKLAALQHHQSQMPEDFDPDDQGNIDGFAQRFGTEWFIATPAVPNADFGPLAPLLQPKAEFSAPEA